MKKEFLRVRFFPPRMSYRHTARDARDDMSEITLNVLEPIDLDSAGEGRRDRCAFGEDAALLDRFMKGEDAALVELFDRHNRRLLFYCLKLTGDRDQAKDLTQELWEKVLRLRARPKRIDNPAAFFLTIARNLCLNYLGSYRKRKSTPIADEADFPSQGSDEQGELEGVILDSLEQLPFEQREVIILNVYCGYRFEEIATMLGKSPEAIWKRASRARKQLREIVLNSEVFDEKSNERKRA